MSRRSFLVAEGGAAVTEFALVAPVFLIMLFLLLDGGRMLFTKQALNELATAAARCAALKPTGCTTVSEVQSWAADRGHDRSQLQLTSAMVTVTMSGSCNGQSNMAQAAIAMPYKKGAMNLLPQSAAPSTLRATACFPVAS